MNDTLTAQLRFSIIPEWILDAAISDKAVRLYGVLARYADNETHRAYPSRETLAKRMGCHAKSVDRAAAELIRIGAVTKKQRHNSSLVYTLMASKGVDTDVQGVVTPVSRGVDTDVHLTRTTELEPKNYIEKQSKAKRIPTDWKPSDTFTTECEQKFPTLIISNEVEAFVDYHTANGSVFKDHQAAFRTWCRNAVKFQAPKTVVHKQEVKPAALIPGYRDWVEDMHDLGEHWECREGEFGCK
jgi:hypothetical protein